MLNDVNENFDHNNDYHKNQQLIRHRDLFRVVTVKKWGMRNHNNVNFIRVIKS